MRNQQLANLGLALIWLLICLFSSRISAQMQGYLLWNVYPNAPGHIGGSVASIGDLNRDGFDDIIAAGPPTSTNMGTVLLISGVDGRVLRTLKGSEPIDGFGVAVDLVGDLNRDGYADVIVGSCNSTVNSLPNVGAARVFSGKDGTVLHNLGGLGKDDGFGWSVAGAGDVDRDGIPDMIVGAIQSIPPVRPGYAIVYSGANGKILYYKQGLTLNGCFGAAVGGAGDLDGDGYADFMVGEPNHDNQTPNIGMITAFSGKTGGVLLTLFGPSKDSGFGDKVASVGDVDGDKVPDIIGSTMAVNTRTGYAAVFSGKTGQVIYSYYGKQNLEALGASVAGGKDLNRDGVPDFLIGAPQVVNSGPGYINLYSGKDGSLLLSINGKSVGDMFGRRLAIGGRLDGDQVDDIVVAAQANYDGDLYAYSLIPPARASLSPAPKVGASISVNLSSPGDAHFAYTAGFALGTTPGVSLPDKRVIPVNSDWLLQYSLVQPNPHFQNVVGILDGQGKATVTFNIPPWQFLIGQTIYGAYIVFDQQAPLGIRRISQAIPIKFE